MRNGAGSVAAVSRAAGHTFSKQTVDVVRGFDVRAGDMGENVTTHGLDLLGLPAGAEGNVVRKAGVMAVVLAGGDVRVGDAIPVELPPGPQRPLEPV